jgi:hypothetical protein
MKLKKFKENHVSNMVMFKECVSVFLALINVTEFHTVEAYSSLCPTSVQCNINKLSRVEEE